MSQISSRGNALILPASYSCSFVANSSRSIKAKAPALAGAFLFNRAASYWLPAPNHRAAASDEGDEGDEGGQPESSPSFSHFLAASPSTAYTEKGRSAPSPSQILNAAGPTAEKKTGEDYKARH
jgi:hypothetical protein